MKDEKCINCVELSRCRDSYTSWFFFIIGLIATIAIRVVTVLIHLRPVYGKIAWYIGIGGFFIFFLNKYNVNQSRGRLISQKKLIDKVRSPLQLAEEDYNLISDILCSISSRKETINYFFIFGLSALALILAVYVDFIK